MKTILYMYKFVFILTVIPDVTGSHMHTNNLHKTLSLANAQ